MYAIRDRGDSRQDKIKSKERPKNMKKTKYQTNLQPKKKAKMRNAGAALPNGGREMRWKKKGVFSGRRMNVFSGLLSPVSDTPR